MFSLVIKPRAIAMIRDAYQWYEEQRAGLGEDLLTELDLYYKKIIANPTHYGILRKKYRKVALDRFPYVIIYEVFKQEIVVFAVFHTGRNPRKIFRN